MVFKLKNNSVGNDDLNTPILHNCLTGCLLTVYIIIQRLSNVMISCEVNKLSYNGTLFYCYKNLIFEMTLSEKDFQNFCDTFDKVLALFAPQIQSEKRF